MGQLPQDPIMLYSVINTKLRDFYSSLEVLCEDMGLSEEELKEKLSSAGFEYDKDRNQFIQYYKNFFLIPVILLLTSAQPLPLLLLSVLLLFHLNETRRYTLSRCIPLILYFYICLRTILYSSSIWKYGQLSDEPDNILARSSSSKFT